MGEIIKKKDSRRIFIETLIKLAEKDEKIVLIVCDVGFLYIEEFQKHFPKRFFNLGVTEQSAIIIASAMALAGYKPYVYTMINFVLFRPAEMVRNAIVKHDANVKLLGVKGGPSYGFLGFSHNLSHEKEDTNFCENIDLPWYIPKLEEVEKTIIDTYKDEKGAYIRL